jgi:hypothetical protein
MSLRVASTSLIPGALVVGDRGLGVLGSEVPSTGESGPGYLYNDLSLPADADKEVCGRVTTWPTGGTLYAYEDSSFTYDGTTDSFWYQLYVDGVATGSPVQVSLNIGVAAAALSITTGDAVFSGSVFVSPVTAFAITTGDAVAAFDAGAATAAATVINVTTDAAVFAGTVYGNLHGFTQDQLDFLVAYLEANMAFPTPADIAAAILAAAQVTPIHSNVQAVNDYTVKGSGTESDPWNPV